MHGRDIIVIGGSAGGIEAVKTIIAGLPADLPAAVFVVIHIAGGSISVLPEILSRAGVMPAVHPTDGALIHHGRVYVAPPDLHLLLKPGPEARLGHVHLGRGPRENRCRPAVDPLFRTAARTFGPRVIAIVLSGNLDDGTAGLAAVRSQCGTTIVQDPLEASFPSMPTSAVSHVEVDHVLPVAQIAPLLGRLVKEPVPETPADVCEPDVKINGRALAQEADIAELVMEPSVPPVPQGRPSPYACPECGGVMFEVHEGRLLRFRCRVGHAMSHETLLMAQADSAEASLWSAMRNLEESAALCERLANRSEEVGDASAARRFSMRAKEARDQATALRGVIGTTPGSPRGEAAADPAARVDAHKRKPPTSAT